MVRIPKWLIGIVAAVIGGFGVHYWYVATQTHENSKAVAVLQEAVKPIPDIQRHLNMNTQTLAVMDTRISHLEDGLKDVERKVDEILSILMERKHASLDDGDETAGNKFLSSADGDDDKPLGNFKARYVSTLESSR